MDRRHARRLKRFFGLLLILGLFGGLFGVLALAYGLEAALLRSAWLALAAGISSVVAGLLWLGVSLIRSSNGHDEP